MARSRRFRWVLGVAVLVLAIVAIVATSGSFRLGAFQQTGQIEIPLIP